MFTMVTHWWFVFHPSDLRCKTSIGVYTSICARLDPPRAMLFDIEVVWSKYMYKASQYVQ